MTIGLWSDCHNFPSLPLMKLSSYHKSNRDNIQKLYAEVEGVFVKIQNVAEDL